MDWLTVQGDDRNKEILKREHCWVYVLSVTRLRTFAPWGEEEAFGSLCCPLMEGVPGEDIQRIWQLANCMLLLSLRRLRLGQPNPSPNPPSTQQDHLMFPRPVVYFTACNDACALKTHESPYTSCQAHIKPSKCHDILHIRKFSFKIRKAHICHARNDSSMCLKFFSPLGHCLSFAWSTQR
jgi:hypothetical protein